MAALFRKRMKLPICKRLLLCASLIPPGQRVADIGTDHGYLPIYLLQTGRAPFVTAADLREQPLAVARANASKYAVADRMDFLLSDGLQKLSPDAATVIVMAGMGGDLMVRLLQDAPWVCSARYTLVLQPQSAGQALRRYLAENGFCIEREELVQDGRFLYTVLRATKGAMPPLSPGQEYVSPALLQAGSPLLPQYLARLTRALRVSVEGLRKTDRPERLQYYEQALSELEEMKQQL